MKKLILLSLLLSGSIGQMTAFSQTKNREIGLKTPNLDHYTILYKHERKPNRYLRFGLGLAANYSNILSLSTSNRFSSNVSFSVGFEKRVKLSNKFELLHGFTPSIGASYNYLEDSGILPQPTNRDVLSLQLGLGYILGGQYLIAKNFSIGAELIPLFNINYSNVKSNQANFENIETISSGLRLRSGFGLFCVYKFNK